MFFNPADNLPPGILSIILFNFGAHCLTFDNSFAIIPLDFEISEITLPASAVLPALTNFNPALTSLIIFEPLPANKNGFAKASPT